MGSDCPKTHLMLVLHTFSGMGLRSYC